MKPNKPKDKNAVDDVAALIESFIAGFMLATAIALLVAALF